MRWKLAVAVAVATLTGFVAAAGPAQAAQAADTAAKPVTRADPAVSKKTGRTWMHRKDAKPAHVGPSSPVAPSPSAGNVTSSSAPVKRSKVQTGADETPAPSLSASVSATGASALPATPGGPDARAEDDAATTAMSAAFTPSTIDSGDSTDLVFTLTWSSGTGPATNVAFTAALPTQVGVVGSGATWYATTCGGTVSQPVATSVRLEGATVPASGGCTLTIHVTVFQAGSYSLTDSVVSDKNTGLQPSFTAPLTVTGHPYLVAFFQPPAQTAAGVPTAMGIGVINPTQTTLPFTFTATLPAHMTIAATTSPVPQSDCLTAFTATAGGSTVTLSGNAFTTVSFSGCGAFVPVVIDAPGTYPATGIAISNVTNVPSHITDLAAIGNCPQCSLFATSLTVTPPLTPQTITFGPFGDVALSAVTKILTGSATSGLPLAYTSRTSAVCTVSGSTVTLLTSGTCTIAAEQAGDSTYAAADAVTASFGVIPPAQPPTGVAAVAGTSSVSVSWTAPGDTTGISGYTVTASPGPATCTTTSATATSCVLGGTAGTTYTVTVVANSPGGNSISAGPSNAAPVAAPVPPAAPPATNLRLTTDKGQISTAAPGEQITFVGSGFAPHSTVLISIYSAPAVLGEAVTDGSGSFSKPITVPASLAAGAHTAVAQGVAPDGAARSMSLAITVPTPVTPSSSLPVTGAAVSLMLLIGLATVGTGAAVLLATRRRTGHCL